MPLFAYSAYNVQGKKQQGTVEAASLSQAKERLREQSLMATSLKAYLRTSRTKLKSKELLEFTAKMRNLLKAKIPLAEALKVVGKSSSKRVQEIAHVVIEKIETGHSFSNALEAFPQTFSSFYRSCVEAGEVSGQLPSVFSRLHVHYQEQYLLQKKLVAALTYPALLALFSCGVVILLLMYVVPSIEALVDMQKAAWLTKAVVGTSRFFRAQFLFIVIALLLFFSSLGYLFFSKKGRCFLVNTLFYVPLVREMLQDYYTQLLFENIASLLAASVPLLKAVSLSKEVLNDPGFKEKIEEMEQAVAEGKSLSEELQKNHKLSPSSCQLVEIGERTGQLAQMMQEAAFYHKEELQQKLETFTSLLQPALLVLMGAVIGVIMFAVLLPVGDIQVGAY